MNYFLPPLLDPPELEPPPLLDLDEEPPELLLEREGDEYDPLLLDLEGEE